MAAQFASYPQLTIEERKHLTVTRWYLPAARRWGDGAGWGETSIKIKNQKSKPNYPAFL